MDYYSAMNRSEVMIHATAWRNLEKLKSKSSHTQKATHRGSICMNYPEWGNTYTETENT